MGPGNKNPLRERKKKRKKERKKMKERKNYLRLKSSVCFSMIGMYFVIINANFIWFLSYSNPKLKAEKC